MMLLDPKGGNDVDRTIKILGISGSARRGSYNTALLGSAAKVLPKGVVLDIYDISRFPLFNEDLEENPPMEVAEFKKKVEDADAILIATPEYNYSVSAVLKNAIEWGNRPDNSWDGKPVAILSASTGPRGGARAQLHLRQIMVDLNMHPLNQPHVFVSRAQEKFDSAGRLIDEDLRSQLGKLLRALVEWASQLRRNFVVESN